MTRTTRNFFATAIFATAQAPASPEVALWRAVILQAMRDAVGGKTHADAARAWLEKDTRYFRFVCSNADLDPDWVRRQARGIVAGEKKLRRSGSRPAVR